MVKVGSNEALSRLFIPTYIWSESESLDSFNRFSHQTRLGSTRQHVEGVVQLFFIGVMHEMHNGAWYHENHVTQKKT